MTNKKRYIIGLGNYAKSDDGIGLHIVEYIIDNGLDQGFQAVEIGNDGLKLLTYFQEQTAKILLIDCALIERKPGEYLIFDPRDVITQKQTANITTHEGDVLKLLELADQLKYPIPDIKVLAIQPASLEVGMDLSPELESNLDHYAQTAIKEIKT